MDLRLNETQIMIKNAVQQFLAAECSKKKVRECEESEAGFDPVMWRKIGRLGWLGMIVPESYGGMGLTFQELVIMLEVTGYNILPGPLFPAIAGSLAILEMGSESQKQALLPLIASGEMIPAVAVYEQGGNIDPVEINATAVPVDGGFTVSGKKLFVEMAHAAGILICLARTGTGNEDISAVIVDAKTPGISIKVMPTIGSDKLCEVTLERVFVPEADLLGKLNGAWSFLQKVFEYCALAKCAELLGGMQACLDITVAYSKERVQYDKPIGSYQALQHLIANMYISTVTARQLIYRIACMVSEGITCGKEIALAKSYVNEAYKDVAHWGVRLHGALGTTRDYDIALYYRRAKAADYAFGATDYYRKKAAIEIGLR